MKKYLMMLGLFSLCLSAAGCSSFDWLSGDDDKVRLPGERISVLQLQEKIEPADAALQVDGLVTPPPWQNEFWPQAGGYPNHAMQNLALNEGALTRAWTAKIGHGAKRGLPLTAPPIVIDGRIYTMDSRAVVSGFDIKNGTQLWRTETKKPSEDETVIAGGIAYSAGTIYATNGFNEIVALSPKNGAVQWRVDLPAPARAAPTIMDGRVFVQTLNNRLLALNGADGAVIWDYQAAEESAGLVGAASTAVNQDIAVAAFSSGDLVALRVNNGAFAWADNLSTVKRFGGLAGISDIKALPVLDRDMVIAISFGGRLIALDANTGTRLWTREIGSANTPWVAGNHIFIVSNTGQLVAVGRDRGVIRWVTSLMGDNDKKSDGQHYVGPVFAGGRLFLAGDDGDIIEVNPEDGVRIRTWDHRAGISIAPIVAGRVLYVLDNNGILSAYR